MSAELINIIAADTLAPVVARSAAAIILINFVAALYSPIHSPGVPSRARNVFILISLETFHGQLTNLSCLNNKVRNFVPRIPKYVSTQICWFLYYFVGVFICFCLMFAFTVIPIVSKLMFVIIPQHTKSKVPPTYLLWYLLCLFNHSTLQRFVLLTRV